MFSYIMTNEEFEGGFQYYIDQFYKDYLELKEKLEKEKKEKLEEYENRRLYRR